jgi:hypothetical protein
MHERHGRAGWTGSSGAGVRVLRIQRRVLSWPGLAVLARSRPSLSVGFESAFFEYVHRRRFRYGIADACVYMHTHTYSLDGYLRWAEGLRGVVREVITVRTGVQGALVGTKGGEG